MNLEKMIRYYTKVVEQNSRSYGDDWRTVKYQGYLDRILELKDKQDLNAEEQQFMDNRDAIAEVFGK